VAAVDSLGAQGSPRTRSDILVSNTTVSSAIAYVGQPNRLMQEVASAAQSAPGLADDATGVSAVLTAVGRAAPSAVPARGDPSAALAGVQALALVTGGRVQLTAQQLVTAANLTQR
jgi:hypothetical protein